jgi:serine/threonine protein kinase
MEIKRYLLQIAEACNYLHEKNLIHGDLKPENIVIAEKLTNDIDLNKNLTLKLIDISGEASKGTQTYMSPQVCLFFF